MQPLVDRIMYALLTRVPYERICTQLQLGVTGEEVEVVWDRVQGGIIRALTGNPLNEPDQATDPMAWQAFHEVGENLPPDPKQQRGKVLGGTWNEWYEGQTDKK